MRIKQAYVGASYFRSAFLAKWGLKYYYTAREPAVFFGIYKNQRQKLLNHQSYALAVWAGSDAMQIKPDFASKLRNSPNIRHIAISSFISKDLDIHGIPHTILPITPEDYSLFKPAPLGDCIYMYLLPKKLKFYGADTLAAIKKELPNIKVITAGVGDHTRLELSKIYKKCFMGVRPVPHDGMSNTVIELGMMGRRCIWNGKSPNAIPFTNTKSIIDAIKAEHKKIGESNRLLSKKMSTFVDIGDSWLDITPDMLLTKPRYNKIEVHKQSGRRLKIKNATKPAKRSFVMKQIERIKEEATPSYVSVIINTYKEDETILRQAIESYISQMGVSTQVIISTVVGDTAVKIAESYQGVEIFQSEEPGIYQQLNNALEMVSGDWFVYASGNDIAKPNKLYNEVECCRRNNKLICYSDFVIVDHKLKMIKKRMFHPYDPEMHLKGNYVNDCALMHRSILDKFKPFNWQKWGNHAYYDFWLRVYRQIGDVFCYNQSFEWFYRMSPTSSHVVRAQDTAKKLANKKIRNELTVFHRQLRKR